jgi:hypothetical protein
MSDAAAADIARIVESARRLGVELDEEDTRQWLAALAAEPDTETGDIVVDATAGAFGHRVSMLDFSARDLERFRRIGVHRPEEGRLVLRVGKSVVRQRPS